MQKFSLDTSTSSLGGSGHLQTPLRMRFGTSTSHSSVSAAYNIPCNTKGLVDTFEQDLVD